MCASFGGRGRAPLGALLLLVSCFVQVAAPARADVPFRVAAEDGQPEAAKLVAELNDLMFGFSYFEPDNDSGDDSVVTPFKFELDAANGVLRWAVRSEGKSSETKWAYEFSLAAVKATLHTFDADMAELCDGCRKIPQGTEVHALEIQCRADECVREFTYKRDGSDWTQTGADTGSHFRIVCPSEISGDFEGKFKSLLRLYGARHKG